jgi:hypothetical protein
MTSIQDIKKRLESFVKIRSVDSTLTHLKHVFLFKNQDKICGSFNGNEIKIWMSSNPVIGACYPVIQLRINDTHNKIIIKSRMNQIGLAIAILINLGIIWASLNMFILREDLTNDSILQRLIVFVVFIGIFNFPIYMSYKGARDVLIKEIEDAVQIKKPLIKR